MAKESLPISPHLLKVLKEKVFMIDTSVARLSIIVRDLRRDVSMIEEHYQVCEDKTDQ
ncbi:MAG: hypothetical protein WCG04_02040 [Alphaproteobacteria bacterium]